VSPDELVALLEGIRAKAGKAAGDAAMAMGQTYQDYVQNVTLVRREHPPQTWTDSPRGSSPAEVTGALRRSITCVRGPGGGTYGSSVVAPHTVYAAVQEFGAVIRAHPRVRGGWTGKYLGGKRGRGQHTMRFVVDGEQYFPMVVEVPERPYMRPAARDCIANGSLSEAAGQSFMATVFG
jgi:hypothetical protein